MSDNTAVLGQVQVAFAQCERPEHFTNYNHCEECAEHDELLRSRGPGTLQIADMGSPGLDPLCYVYGGLRLFLSRPCAAGLVRP